LGRLPEHVRQLLRLGLRLGPFLLGQGRGSGGRLLGCLGERPGTGRRSGVGTGLRLGRVPGVDCRRYLVALGFNFG
jgi:hypothetical protein